MGVIQPRFPFVGVEILTGCRYGRKPIKGSTDTDDSLVSKKKPEQKIGSLDWRLGPGKVGHKNANPPLLVTPKRTPNPQN